MKNVFCTLSLPTYTSLFTHTSLWTLLLLSACATTTGAFEGTSGSLENTTEASSRLTSSTSPDSSGGDESAKVHRNEINLEQAIHFSEDHFDKLKRDAARGDGEYLVAVGTFLGVSEGKQDDFSTLVRRRFDSLFIEGNPSADVAVMRIHRTLNKNAELRIN